MTDTNYYPLRPHIEDIQITDSDRTRTANLWDHRGKNICVLQVPIGDENLEAHSNRLILAFFDDEPTFVAHSPNHKICMVRPTLYRSKVHISSQGELYPTETLELQSDNAGCPQHHSISPKTHPPDKNTKPPSGTPGTWRFDQTSRTIVDQDGVILAFPAIAFQSGPEEYLRNARIMTASPELLKAIEALMAGHDDCCDACRNAYWLIEQIRGPNAR